MKIHIMLNDGWFISEVHGSLTSPLVLFTFSHAETLQENSARFDLGKDCFIDLPPAYLTDEQIVFATNVCFNKIKTEKIRENEINFYVDICNRFGQTSKQFDD